MKKNLVTLCIAASLAGALFTSAIVRAQSTPPPATPVPVEPKHKGHERHPGIHKAILALDEAKAELKNADHDFGGHRAKALEECDKAVAQLRLALEFDKK